MSKTMRLLMMLATAAVPMSFAWADVGSQDQVESKVKQDLEAAIGKVLDPAQFVVQVSAQVETVNERQLVEGEQLTQVTPKAQEENVPPLPGFDPPAATNSPQQPSQTRQVFKSVQKPVLKAVSVNLLLDRHLEEASAKSVEQLARNYLNSSYPSTSHLAVQQIEMRPAPSATATSGASSWFKNLSPEFLGLAAVVALALAFLYFRQQRMMAQQASWGGGASRSYKPGLVPMGELNEEFAQARDVTSAVAPAPLRAAELAAPERTKEKSAFAGVPANPQYADNRRELLDAFLKNASVFRIYFRKLDDIARGEICAALSGPAFDTLIESLRLERPEVLGQPPSEEQLKFYLKNFSEFEDAFKWQDSQFFGFLSHLNEDQIVALVQSHSAVVGALVLKFCPADMSGAVLGRLSDELRSQVIVQFERTREIPAEELKAIEETVRHSVRSLPRFILGSTGLELDYWTQVLSSSTDPGKVLTSLEQARPDLYERLARFRFQLEDLPSLPTQLLRKVMDDIENDELAMGLSRQSKDVIGYALSELSEARRQLIESQILSYRTVESSDVKVSADRLTRKFREVLA